MELPVNRLKQALAAGHAQYGLWLGLPDTACAEICAGAGFDWLVVDTEHGPFDLPAVLRHLQTIAAYDVQAVVRPVSDDRNVLKQLLDTGVQSLVVPMVESAEQAAELVRSVRYPPAGIRGLGTALARAARWNRIPGYPAQGERADLPACPGRDRACRAGIARHSGSRRDRRHLCRSVRPVRVHGPYRQCTPPGCRQGDPGCPGQDPGGGKGGGNSCN